MLRTVQAHRPSAVPVATLVVAALLLTLSGASPAEALTPRPASEITPAPAELPQTPTVDVTPHVVDLTFPVAQPSDGVRFTDDFLALRGGGSRLHAATDVMAPKHRAVHAAVGGTISFAPSAQPSYGWMLSIRGDDGVRYSYVHINNDTPARDANGRWLDDDRGGIGNAYAPRIVQAIASKGTANGLRVERGELIGWLGDSGNAKGIASHLHFEMELAGPDGPYRINPYPSLKASLADGDVAGPTPLRQAGTPAFGDVPTGAAHTPAILRLHEAGVVTGCEPARFCPHEAVTRGDLAAFLAAARGLVPGGTPRGFDDVGADDPNAGAIAAVEAAGMLAGYGDGRFGPHDPLSRAQLATVLVQGFDVPAHPKRAPFDDVAADGTHSANIAAAHAAGLTNGCEDGRNYCGSRSVTRGQVASFIDGALGAA